MTSNNTVRKARNFAARELKNAEAGADPYEALDDAGTPPSARRYFADGLTRYGRPNQCAGCGAFRLDGRPPTVHRTDCVYGPDGSQLPPVFNPDALRPKTAPAVKTTLTEDRHAARRRR